VTHVENQCRTAGWGCIECKKVLFENMNAELTPIRARAEEIRANPSRIDEVVGAGAATARRVAGETMREVKDRMGLA
jgi:tryptophanyl-tRNA synthetase